MKTMKLWLQKKLRALVGIDDLQNAVNVAAAKAETAARERHSELATALTEIAHRLTAAHIDLSKERRGVPLLDYDTLQAMAAKELDGPPPKDSPFAEM
jgi:hypothetical protein